MNVYYKYHLIQRGDALVVRVDAFHRGKCIKRGRALPYDSGAGIQRAADDTSTTVRGRSAVQTSLFGGSEME